MQNHLKTASILTKLLDEEFKIFGFKFGLDPLIGLIPGIGDSIAFFLSLYLLWIAVNLNIPNNKKFQMLFNIVFDFLLGLIPFIGDISDFIFKANSRNLKILKDYLKN